jgi:energy-coupling factor transporter transmembrane protein EcfT
MCIFFIILVKNLQFKYLSWLKGLIFISIFIVIFQTVTYSAETWFDFIGLMEGFYSTLRIMTLASLMFLFINTTRLNEIAKTLSFLPKNIIFVLTVSLGLINILEKEFKIIETAQKSRGHKHSWNILKSYLPILVPLFTKSIVRAEKITIAMQSRGLKIFIV